MKNLWKHSGTFLWATGVVHSVFGLGAMWQSHVAIMSGGVGNDTGRELAFWFLVCGILLIFFGLTLQYYLRATQRPAPAFLGWCLLVFTIVGCAVVPVSGFWLFLPQALIIIAAKRRH